MSLRAKELTPHRLRMQRNTLIAYHGGGYPGCIWEWNYAWMDDNRRYHDIASSGFYRCDTLDKLVERLEYMQRFDDHLFLYREEKGEFLEFCREHDAGHVKGVAEWMHEHTDKVIVYPCESCGSLEPVTEMFFGSCRGSGGTGVSYEGLLCTSCMDDADRYWYFKLINEDGEEEDLELSHLDMIEKYPSLWEAIYPHYSGMDMTDIPGQPRLFDLPSEQRNWSALGMREWEWKWFQEPLSPVEMEGKIVAAMYIEQ